MPEITGNIDHARDLLVFSEDISPRFTYIATYILVEQFGLKLTFTQDPGEFGVFKGSRLNYSGMNIPGCPSILPTGLLSEKSVRAFEVPMDEYRDTIILFPVKGNAMLPFDIFSAAFYMISRYEEYLPFEADLHGRFRAEKSLAFRHGFVDKPVINIWLEWLKKGLGEYYPGLVFRKKEFRYIPTIDIDQACAYRHKGFIRISGGLVKALLKGQWKELKTRLLVISRLRRDPFDTFDEFQRIHHEAGISATWFILFGNHGNYDKNLSPDNSYFRRLILGLKQKGRLGIHPSYGSNDNQHKFKSEVYQLSHLLGGPVGLSRQHFLKLNLPHTYHNLINIGILEDYSMGFAQRPGFRAGICDPFPFYDLEKEEETRLVVYPFTLMDGTLKDIMHLTRDEAIETIYNLVNTVRKFNGTFIPVWHNESLSEKKRWRGWKRVYEEMTRFATDPEATLA